MVSRGVLALLFVAWIGTAICDPDIPETLYDFIHSSVTKGAPTDRRYDWYAAGQDELSETLKRPTRLNFNQATNTILIIGDGMGLPSVTSARIYAAQKSGKSGNQNLPPWDKFPFSGLARTHSAARQTTDSAAGGTSLLCGEKVQDTTFGISWKATFNNCSSAADNKLTSVLDYAYEAGKRVGIVTNTRITHATPGSAYAHIANRDWEGKIPLDVMQPGCKDVAAQLIDDNHHINVLLGGGRQNFFPETMTDSEYGNKMGVRIDNRNLVDDWRKLKKNQGLSDDEYVYTWRESDFKNVDPNKVKHLLGLFEPSHMQYEAQRSADGAGEPSLTDMVEKAIQILEKGDKGYFLLIESGRMDHAHHDCQAKLALEDSYELIRAVNKVLSMVDDKDTLVVMTADHSHSFYLSGYSTIDSDITGLSDSYDSEPQWFLQSLEDPSKAQDKKPYTILGYFNGPGYWKHRWEGDEQTGREVPRKDITNDDVKTLEYVQDAPVPMQYSTHGGEDVAIFALGPHAHLFTGSHEQNFIHHAINYAMCTGKGRKMCDEDAPNDNEDATCGAQSFTFSLIIILVTLCISLL